jgi:histone deacetylase 1/2
MDIVFDPAARTMLISQLNSVNTLLERAKMTDCNPVLTPSQPGTVWTKKDCPEVQESGENCTQYRALVALANFIANWTRPDITFTVNKLCKYMQGTKHWGLSYNFSEAKISPVAGLYGFTDASYADCPDTSKSTIGYTFFYGGAILSWFSKLHTYRIYLHQPRSMLHLQPAPKKLSGSFICLKNWNPKPSTLQSPFSSTTPVLSHSSSIL